MGTDESTADEGGGEESKVGVFEVERLDDVLVLIPTESKMGELNADNFTRDLQIIRNGLNNEDSRKILVDFHRTSYFGSTVIGELVRLWKDIRSRKGQMVFCGLSDHERDVLQAAKLDEIWTLCASRDEAIKKLDQPDGNA